MMADLKSLSGNSNIFITLMLSSLYYILTFSLRFLWSFVCMTSNLWLKPGHIWDITL